MEKLLCFKEKMFWIKQLKVPQNLSLHKQLTPDTSDLRTEDGKLI